MDGQQYRHILYYSPSHIEQLFVDRIGEETEVVEETETRFSQRLVAGLNVFLNGSVEGKHQTRKNVMKSVNQSEEHIQTKKVVNDLLQDESIPRIKGLDLDDVSPLYRFSCECQILPSEEDEFSDSKLVEVVGKEGDIKFRGVTSLENWSSLSDTLFAVNNDIPYPLDGIIQLRDVNDQMLREVSDGWELEQADCDVNFVFICQSNQDEVQKWWNRRDLLGEYYEQKSD
ncbi:hypothetical protein C5B91_10055 [Haloferax sp. Atlit-10N]|nr:hypothetical protein C5B87_10915 [Haloferax sp. Atlit-16N]RDZ59535.1 hypothetical protein C5B91_10055 [Haloferax sp. Atlit-10N]